MSIVYLGLGSNIDAEANISSGIDSLRSAFRGLELSPAYSCPANGFEGDEFINLVARVDTDMGPLELKGFLHDLEDRHGRARDVPRWSDRTLDIDILLYDDLWLLSPDLELPREEILSFAHVLKPLAELAPNLIHPVLQKTIAELWNGFPERHSGLELIEL